VRPHTLLFFANSQHYFLLNFPVPGTSSNEYRGIVHALSSIVKNEGCLGLYRGLTPNLMASGVSWGVYFFSYNQFKTFFKRRVYNSLSQSEQYNHKDLRHIPLGPLTHLLCAAGSGMLATTITNPISMVKTRLQLQGKEIQTQQRMYTGVVDAFTRIAKEEGVISFYRGLGPSLVLVSNGALQFMCYEELKKIVSNYLGGEHLLNPQHYFVMGGLAKIFSSTVTYPFAVTRARLFARAPDPQILINNTNSNATIELKQYKYANMSEVLHSTWTREGWRGFYRGLVPQLIKTAPSSAITFLIYETVIKIFNPITTINPSMNTNLAPSSTSSSSPASSTPIRTIN
jgi:solute carrier family 25 folate transporter 32